MADPAARAVPGRRRRAPTSLAEVRAAYPDLPPDTETGDVVGVTGRVIFVRNTGKLCFATLREGDAELQVMLSLDRVGADSLAAWKADVDLGDLVFVARRGHLVQARRTVGAGRPSGSITAKALRPLPVAHKPLSEETRVRQRYVDLIVRPEARRDGARRGPTVLRSLRDDAARPRLPRGRDADPADRCTAARRRGRSTRTSTHSTSTCRCASPPSCT